MNRWTLGLGVSALAVLAAGNGAWAQNAATDVEEVVVTGTFLAGTPEGGAQSVDVITAQELEQRGAPTMVELIKTIGASQSVVGESNRFLGGTAGAATVNLRGFGAARTLVLFNSRRLAYAPSAAPSVSSAVDINLIPQAAIGRIEVLREGAAATYGSEAVGGVVNFLSRRDLEGLELDASYGFIRGSNGDYSVNGAYGWRNDRGNLLLTAGYRRRSELWLIDRDEWSMQPPTTNAAGWSTASTPGVFLTGTAAQLASGAFATSFLDNGCVELGGVLANPASPAAGCRYHPTISDNLVNDEHHYQLYGEVNFDLADDLEFHGEAMWVRRVVPHERVMAASSTTQFPSPIAASGGSPGGGTSPYPAVGLNQQSRFYVPNTNPGLVAFLAQNCPGLGAAVCTNAAANGVVASPTLWRPLGFGGNPLTGGAALQRRQAEAFRVAGSFKGRLPILNAKWDAGVTYMRAEGYAENGPGTSVSRLQLALRGLGGPGCNPATGTPGVGPCQYFNPFANAYPGNPITGERNPFHAPAAANSAEVWGWIEENTFVESVNQLFTADAVLSGEAPITLPGGAVAWAVGGQWRYDSTLLRSSADLGATPCVDSLPYGDGLPLCTGGTGPFTFVSASTPIDVDRRVAAGFAELRIPLTTDFEITGAVRHERFGGAFGSTTNPKLSARWQATPWLAVRGSVGTTFRAPDQTALSPRSTRGVSLFTLPGVGALYRTVDVAGNPGLTPEKATTYNAGLVVRAGGFSATVDYYKIAFRNELTNEVAGRVVSTMFPGTSPATWGCANAVLRARFTFSDDGDPTTDDCTPAKLLGVRTNLINGPDVDTSGVDFNLRYDMPFADGELSFAAEGTYLIAYKRGDVVAPEGFLITPAANRAGTSELLNAFYSYPRLKLIGSINYNRGDHNLRWVTRFQEGTDNLVTGAPTLRTKDEIQHDLIYAGMIGWDTRVTIAVKNILDSNPPFARSQYNYDYTQGSPLGRVVEIGLRRRF
ncbi:TonB-dependent receptor [Phenylobacterium sp.]|uniref:TonB-dependent receptor domain-containing protein n=1 Tax=Phenylobacterium sp. TaxID=1871053 RepID=UPI00301D4C02